MIYRIFIINLLDVVFILYIYCVNLVNVTLGYNFTPKNRKLLDNMRIYLSAKNLFTLTGYSGNDPSIIDVNGIQPGVDSNSAYPTATQLSLGVTLRFK